MPVQRSPSRLAYGHRAGHLQQACRLDLLPSTNVMTAVVLPRHFGVDAVATTSRRAKKNAATCDGGGARRTQIPRSRRGWTSLDRRRSGGAGPTRRESGSRRPGDAVVVGGRAGSIAPRDAGIAGAGRRRRRHDRWRRCLGWRWHHFLLLLVGAGREQRAHRCDGQKSFEQHECLQSGHAGGNIARAARVRASPDHRRSALDQRRNGLCGAGVPGATVVTEMTQGRPSGRDVAPRGSPAAAC